MNSKIKIKTKKPLFGVWRDIGLAKHILLL